MVTGERQAARIRNLYLKTILRQEISFFDTETNTGEVVGRMSGDTVLIQDAMGEKVLITLDDSPFSFLFQCFFLDSYEDDFYQLLIDCKCKLEGNGLLLCTFICEVTEI